jgi:hypothetical protein
MVRHGGQVQLEYSVIPRAFNLAKFGKRGVSRAAVEEMQQLFKKPSTEVREENQGGVKFFGHMRVNATMERLPVMVNKYHTAGCLPCPNGRTKNPQTH